MGLLRIDSGGCQRICDLPDDLLVKILLLIPTKDALATAILSKRWRHVWKMLPELTFKDDQGSNSFGLFIDKSLQFHEAPRLFKLTVELGPPCHVDDVDVTKWVEKAVNHDVQTLDFKLLGTPQTTTLPTSLYSCKTLRSLSLSDNILVDVSLPASLPSLKYLDLFYVRYKDEDSLARLLSSSPVLDQLVIRRRYPHDDNLTNLTKVPTLTCLQYATNTFNEEEEKDHIGSVVIDTPALTEMMFGDYCWADYCSFTTNMPCLDEVTIRYVPNHNGKLLEHISSTKRLFFSPSVPMIEHNDIKFTRLIDLFFHPEDGINWFEPLLFFLRNSPTLKTLTINTKEHVDPPSSWTWNQPSTIPGCLSSHLEVVRWKNYRGRNSERQFIAYILANSICLKTVEISLAETRKIKTCRNELKSMVIYVDLLDKYQAVPSLQASLVHLRYKDDDSLVRLLSSSPVLDQLVVKRHDAYDDNLTNLTIKVPTLTTNLHYYTDIYNEEEVKDHIGSVVIDTPALTEMIFGDYCWEDYCSFVTNMPCLDETTIRYVPHHNAKFLEHISSSKRLLFYPSVTMIADNDIKFTRLIDLFFHPEDGINWFEPLLFFLRNSPTLKTLTIETKGHENPHLPGRGTNRVLFPDAYPLI